jgi:PmbA protein
MNNELLAIAESVIATARALGSSAAECTVLEGDEFNVKVRLGEVEQLKESGARGAGLRVLLHQQPGSAYTSDLTPDGLRKMVESALGLARITSDDPLSLLPDAADFGILDTDLDLYSPDIVALTAERKIDLARQAERAALDFDPRIRNSEGAAFSSHSGTRAFANSLGFAGSYRTTSAGLSVTPIVEENGKLQRDYYWTGARKLSALDTPQEVGCRAAERVLRRLGARKIDSARVPVIFEPRTARTLLSHLFDAVSGESVSRGASFLAGKLGQKVASGSVTVVDDSTLPGHFASSPFDDEGVRSRRNVVIDQGVLTSYLLNTYTARKLGLRTTASAARGLSGNTSVGHGNLFLTPGAPAAAELLFSAPRALLVTELLGSGVNTVNGDYSRGAAGLWIENGTPLFAVEEVTIASNLRTMLEEITAVASDLDFRGSVGSPTLMIAEMMVSGR